MVSRLVQPYSSNSNILRILSVHKDNSYKFGFFFFCFGDNVDWISYISTQS